MQLDPPSANPSGTRRLLGEGDPEPVLHRRGGGPVLLTVEHAGRAVPGALAGLGLPAGEIDRHIGWDIGALALAETVAGRLNATLIAQRYSRLVIDCNRPEGAPDLVPVVSDRTAVPGNTGRPADELRARWDEIHAPFHDAVAAACGAGIRAIVAVHSYDPRRDVDAAPRPWPLGLVYRVANPLADGLRAILSDDPRAQPLGVNMPYEIEDVSDYTIPVHGEARGLAHVLVEVRNDYLRDGAGIALIAGLLADAIENVDLR